MRSTAKWRSRVDSDDYLVLTDRIVFAVMLVIGLVVVGLSALGVIA